MVFHEHEQELSPSVMLDVLRLLKPSYSQALPNGDGDDCFPRQDTLEAVDRRVFSVLHDRMERHIYADFACDEFLLRFMDSLS